MELSEQEQVRRGSLQAMRALGIDPYPAAEYEVTGHSVEIKANYIDLPAEENGAVQSPITREAGKWYTGDTIRIAGRLMRPHLLRFKTLKAAFRYM